MSATSNANGNTKNNALTHVQRVAREFAAGRIQCSDHRHYKSVRKTIGNTTRTYTEVSPIGGTPGGHKTILHLMMPQDTAKCACQKQACEWAWKPYTQQYVTYASRFVIPGTYTMGVKGQDTKVVFETHYSLKLDDFKQLQIDFPWIYFHTGDVVFDHAVQHIRTAIAGDKVFERLKPANWKRGDPPVRILDVYGNPIANARRNKQPWCQIDTLVQCMDASDRIREVNKWGDPTVIPRFTGSMRTIGATRETEGADIPVGDYDHVVVIHAGYYVDKSEILAMFRWTKPNCSFWLLMHQYSLGAGVRVGSLNDAGSQAGESDWRRYIDTSGRPRIRATNRLTKAYYDHPDNSWWYGQKAWGPVRQTLDGDGRLVDINPPIWGDGFTWDTRLIVADTYLTQVVSCPGNLITAAMVTSSIQTPDEVPLAAQLALKGSVTTDAGIELAVHAPKTYAQCQAQLIGKDRHKQAVFSEHVARYRRLLRDNHEPDTGYVEASVECYFGSLKHESLVIREAFNNSRLDVHKMTAALAGHDIKDPKYLLKRCLIFSAQALKLARSPADKVIGEMLNSTAMSL